MYGNMCARNKINYGHGQTAGVRAMHDVPEYGTLNDSAHFVTVM